MQNQRLRYLKTTASQTRLFRRRFVMHDLITREISDTRQLHNHETQRCKKVAIVRVKLWLGANRIVYRFYVQRFEEKHFRASGIWLRITVAKSEKRFQF